MACYSDERSGKVLHKEHFMIETVFTPHIPDDLEANLASVRMRLLVE